MHPRHEMITHLLRQQRYPEAEAHAIEHVRLFPIDGQGWVLLGEALLHQQNGKMARLMFERAHLLDPEATWMPMAYQELEKAPAGALRQDIVDLLQTKPVSVSAAIIVKNEERCIKRCLDSIIGVFDEIIVVDSGSTDKTLSILTDYPTVKVHQTVWNESFSQLRNEALAHVTSDWVFWLDADEWLHPEDQANVRTAAALYSGLGHIIPVLHVGLINQVNGTEICDYSVPRLFPARRGLYYSGRIHEQIATQEEGIFTSNVLHKPTKIRVFHDGYEAFVKEDKDKFNRNIRLLRLMTQEEPENSGWWYFLGRETMSLGDYDSALDALRKSEEHARANPKFGRMPEVYMLMTRILASRNEWEQAEECCRKALKLHPDFPDARYALAEIQMRKARLLLQEAEGHIGAAVEGFGTYRGTVTADRDILAWKADVLKADLLVHSGKIAEAGFLLKKVRRNHPKITVLSNKLAYFDLQRRLLDQYHQER
ncbi:glycosyltransferase [Paenibacillus ehimensis]|uniref:glycosyltransferase n=1 Tax=Paenibacillus ehimensis TaxID=79264 RepID=UPI0004713871|nr:glycosyltransferase [Paenibacillus ehimensis]